MKRKLIFFDIDGTLIASMASPSVRVAKAIRKAREKGNQVFLCTGRNMAMIGSDILKIGFDGVISSAGAHVEAGGRVLFDHILPESVIQECLFRFHQEGIYCRIESPEGIYTDPQMEALLKQARSDPRNSELIRMQKELEAGIGMRPYQEYPGQGAYKICFTSTTLDAVDRTRPYLEDQFVYVVHPYGTSTSCFNGEIIPRGINKGRGIDIISRYFGSDIRDTVAFGDSMNDYEMLQCAGTGIAMGNACEELKEMADAVCGSVWEDGIYYELHRLGMV